MIEREKMLERLRQITEFVRNDRKAHRIAMREADRWLDWCIGEHYAPDSSSEEAAQKLVRRVLRYPSPVPHLRALTAEITRLSALAGGREKAIEECAQLVDDTAADVKGGLANRLRDPAGLLIGLADDIRALASGPAVGEEGV